MGELTKNLLTDVVKIKRTEGTEIQLTKFNNGSEFTELVFIPSDHGASFIIDIGRNYNGLIGPLKPRGLWALRLQCIGNCTSPRSKNHR